MLTICTLNKLIENPSNRMLILINHPLSMFLVGVMATILTLLVLLSMMGARNETGEMVKDYYRAMELAGDDGPAAGSEEESEAISSFINFLKNVGDPGYIQANTSKAYAANAYLDDTIVTHHGPEEIQAYFLETAATMTGFELKILDTVRSGSDHYIRWEMIFTAPKLANNTPIVSVGVSQVRFNAAGQVAFHQDFWDSGKHIYGQIPLVGGIIQKIRGRME